jgi:hypothetical protein
MRSNTNLNPHKLAKPNRTAAGYQEILLLQKKRVGDRKEIMCYNNGK